MNGSDKESDYDYSAENWGKPSDESSNSQSNNVKNPCGVNDNVHFKILVPSIAAGAIIGKGGEAIAQIQKETGAKVKMSKANDYYPGTTERVCLILGTVESITRMHNYIMEKILEKADTNSKSQTDNRMLGERHKQVKILVPNSTAGMIIGKGGTFIKEIKEASGAFIQISQKSREINLPERCIVIAGELDQNKKATGAILAKIAEDPQSASCPSISYADSQGPVASAYPTGSPYANSSPPHSGLGVSLHDYQVGSGSGPVGQPSGSVIYSPLGVLSLGGPASASSPPGSYSSHHLSPPLHSHQQQQQQQAAQHTFTTGGFPGPQHHQTASPNSLLASVAAAAAASRGGPGGLGLSTGGAGSLGSLQQHQQSSNSSMGSSFRSSGPTLLMSHQQQQQQQSTQCAGGLGGLNMDSLRAALHYAGYPDSASQEIAAAMQVLDKYGFINTTTSSTSIANTGNIHNNSGMTISSNNNMSSSTILSPASSTGGLPPTLGGHPLHLASSNAGPLSHSGCGPVASPPNILSAFPTAAYPHQLSHPLYGTSPPSFNYSGGGGSGHLGGGPPSEDFFMMSSPPDYAPFPLYSPPLQSGAGSSTNSGGRGASLIMSPVGPPAQPLHNPGGAGGGGPGGGSPYVDQLIELPDNFPVHLLDDIMSQCDVYYRQTNSGGYNYVLQGYDWNVTQALHILADKQLQWQQHQQQHQRHLESVQHQQQQQHQQSGSGSGVTIISSNTAASTTGGGTTTASHSTTTLALSSSSTPATSSITNAPATVTDNPPPSTGGGNNGGSRSSPSSSITSTTNVTPTNK